MPAHKVDKRELKTVDNAKAKKSRTPYKKASLFFHQDLQLPLAELELLPVGQASEAAAAAAAAETPELSDGLFLLACSSALALVYFVSECFSFSMLASVP